MKTQAFLLVFIAFHLCNIAADESSPTSVRLSVNARTVVSLFHNSESTTIDSIFIDQRLNPLIHNTNLSPNDVLAIKVKNFGGLSGLLTDFSYNGHEYVSDQTWKCTGFHLSADDSSSSSSLQDETDFPECPAGSLLSWNDLSIDQKKYCPHPRWMESDFDTEDATNGFSSAIEQCKNVQDPIQNPFVLISGHQVSQMSNDAYWIWFENSVNQANYGSAIAYCRLQFLPTTPSSVSGDPMLYGLQGQKFQVHGGDNVILNLLTSFSTQINVQLTYLIPKDLHAGTYIKTVGISIRDVGNVSVTAGSPSQGLSIVSNKLHNLALLHRNIMSTNHNQTQFVIRTADFIITILNQDHYIDMQFVKKTKACSTRLFHGLIGVTCDPRISTYPGLVDDYMLDSNDIFGTDFAYNLF